MSRGPLAENLTVEIMPLLLRSLLLLFAVSGNCFALSAPRPAVEAKVSTQAWPARASPIFASETAPELTVQTWLPRVVKSDAIAPAAVLLAIHSGLRKVLRTFSISFPASIVGMLGGFGLLCLIRCFSSDLASKIDGFFEPACRLFRIWLAAIFAPGFIALPLKMPTLTVFE